MSEKLTTEHVRRRAVVYIRQSTLSQVLEHTESQRRQYELAPMAQRLGFTFVEVIDEDLGRSGSGLQKRPGFERLVASVCSAAVGAIFCIEASRLARNGRDWHHLIDLCALVGTVIVDPDGIYDPRLTNDRLLLGLKGSMSEYELSLLRQRGLESRNSKAKRNELQVPVVRQGKPGPRIQWKQAAYHNLLCIVQNPVYAGAYAFGRTENRTRLDKDQALKTTGHIKPRERWSVLIHDHHPGYITWEEFERNQRMLADNAHMQKRTSRKSGRGGRALLTGMLRCGRCGRMLRVTYGTKVGHSHR